MTSQQQESGLFEIQVPIFCEWTFEKNDDSGMASSLYNYVSDLAKPKGYIYLTPNCYSLPGFPGISYNFDIGMGDWLYVGFEVYMVYQKYQFDADFTCTVTDCEPKHFVQHFNDAKYEDQQFEICRCSEECGGCPLCAKKKIVIRVEGTITVKHVDAFEFFMPLCEAVSKMPFVERENTKDFVIVAENQEIRVHKSALAENSTVFARMFDTDSWKETREGKIVIPDFAYKTVALAIQAFYVYTSFKPHTTKEDYLMIFRFADKYDIEKLTKALTDSIAFTPYNCVEYANFFLQNDVTELINCSIDYILSCSQYSIPIKDIELLDAQVRAMCFDRILVSPVLKKDPKVEHRRFNYDEDDGDESQ